MFLIKTRLVGSALLTAALLSACGGGGDDDSSGQRDLVTNYDLSGVSSGLTGSVSLNWLDQSLIVAGAGNFSSEESIPEGENITLTLSDVPDTQECFISSQEVFNNVSSDITDINITCNDLIGLTVSARNYFTGENIAGAEVNLSWTDEGAALQRSVMTNEDGIAEVWVSPFVGRMSVNADGENFGEQSVIIDSSAESDALSAAVLLLPVNEVITFTAAEGGTLTTEGVDVVDVPGAAFELPNGEVYSGDIEAEITLIDPSSDPEIMPGEYTTTDVTSGEIAQIESYGALNVTFESSAGENLVLASGSTATVRIPVAEGVTNPPETVPLFNFNDTTGHWVQEGEASLTTSGDVPVYEGSVSHFTTWNADVLYESINIIGCVIDHDGNPLANASIRARGSNYIGSASTYTDSNGNFTVAARPSSSVFVSAVSGSQSRTVTVNTGTVDETITSCLVVDEAASTMTLTWGQNPSDLDTHFFGPSDEAGASLFHIYYANQSVDVGETTLYLDVDDTSSFGPEVLTIPRFPYAGTYRYSVHHYSGSGDIQSSPARVELNVNGAISIFSPPAGTPEGCWTPFDLEVDSAGGIVVVPQNTWEESTSSCTSSPDGLVADTESRSVASSPFSNAVKAKHYAK